MVGERSDLGQEGDPLPRVVLVDANVFFAPRMRDLFMYLHEAEILSVHWTPEIETEWTRNVVARHGADPEAIQRCLRGMREAAEDWQVSGYQKFIERFEDVDAKDRHVAAAAYKLSIDDWPGQPVALVTKNVIDFPQRAFAGTRVKRYGMSTYVDALYAEIPEQITRVAEGCRRKLQQPRLSKEDYIRTLLTHDARELACAMARKWRVEHLVSDRLGEITAPSTKPTHRSPKHKSRPARRLKK